MKDIIKKHRWIQTFCNVVKEITNESIRARETPEQLKERIALLCTKCMMPATKDCEICNWYTETTKEIDDIFAELLEPTR